MTNQEQKKKEFEFGANVIIELLVSFAKTMLENSDIQEKIDLIEDLCLTARERLAFIEHKKQST